VFFHHCCGTGDEAPNPYLAAIIEILSAQGEQGWILVQVALREQDMICFRHCCGTGGDVNDLCRNSGERGVR